MLGRRGFVAWGLVATLPVITTIVLLHHPLIGRGAIMLFMLYLSEISVFGISVMAASSLNRSNCFALSLSAVVTFAYAYSMLHIGWVVPNIYDNRPSAWFWCVDSTTPLC